MAREGMGMDISLKVAVTDRKVKKLGASMVAEMSEINWANRRGNTYDASLHGWALMSAARTLEILKIPCKRERNEQGEYVSVTIAGVTFPVEMGG